MIPGWYGRLEAWFASHRILATVPIGVLLVAAAEPKPALLVLGGCLVVTGEAMRLWASGYIDKNRSLATAGPYAHTRNPLYVANLVLLVGFCAMAGNPWVMLLALMAFIMIYRPVIREEAETMRELFGDSYRRWADAVPLFFPRLRPYADARGSFSWRLVRKHRELKNAAAFLLAIAVFCGLYWWRG